jgi:hypothetical protein
MKAINNANELHASNNIIMDIPTEGPSKRDYTITFLNFSQEVL